MSEGWIRVAYIGNEWSNETVYVNSDEEIAKVYRSKCTHWGYHDDSDWDESEEIISIEKALAIVYPDENAIAVILNNTKKDYTKTLQQLENKKG